MMKNRSSILSLVFVCFLVIVLGVFGGLSLQHPLPLDSHSDGVRNITNISYEIKDGQSGNLSLPDSLSGLDSRTSVTLFATFQAQPGESLLVKSVFAPLRLYVNDSLLYEYGQEGTYPTYMNDPPTGLGLVKLPGEGGSFDLRIEYQSLTQRDTLSLPVISIGDDGAILSVLFHKEGFSLLFSLILIFIGIGMTLISLTFIRKLPAGASFLWLGLFSLSAGVWVLGESDLTSFLLPYPSLLYAMDYVGLFCMTIPLLLFGLVVLNPKNKLPFQLMLWIHTLSVAGAFLLQLTGIMDFTRILYWFHVIAPLGFVTFAACLIWEHFRHHNPTARRFAPAIILLAVSTLLEVSNYWLHLNMPLTAFFQLGVLAFIISLGIVSGYYVQQSMRTAAENIRLEYEMSSMDHQLTLQRLQYQKLAEQDEMVKAQRHDLRHHIAVLRSLTADGERLTAYLDGLADKIPSGEGVRLCENYAVNAVAAYYYAMAQQTGIDIDISLIVPLTIDTHLESDLCVVVGNLMENAVEACDRMAEGKGFIRVNSGLEHGILTLTVDNSFSGKTRKQDGTFLSSKRSGEGTGISSVTAVAKKHGGNARFEEKDGIFQASVYMRILDNAQ